MVCGPHCDGCVNQQHGIGLVRTDGLGTRKVLLVGDSPWKDEQRQGRPFAGAAGNLLDRNIARLGLTRSEFLLANSMWCSPLHLGWTDHAERYPDAAAALNHCRPYLDELVMEFQPRCIVSLGNVALQRCAGVSGLDDRHSYLHGSPWGCPVIPTYHPSFILQGNQKYSSVLMFALKRAVEVADGSFQQDQFDLLLDPPVSKLEEYLAGDIDELMCDIETPESGDLDEEASQEEASYTIVRCGFSRNPSSAVTFPWMPPYIDLGLSALRRAKCVLFWNQGFDVPRLRAAGARICGKIIDAMWAWHWLQSDLPKRLGFVAPFYYCGAAWKHLNRAQPAFYNACDNAIQMKCFHGIRRDLQQQGRWDMFMRHCTDTLPILERMGNNGLKVDEAQRVRFMARLQDEYAAAYGQLQSAVPDALKPRKLYKRMPKDTTNIIPIDGNSNAAILLAAADLLKKVGKPKAARRARKGASEIV